MGGATCGGEKGDDHARTDRHPKETMIFPLSCFTYPGILIARDGGGGRGRGNNNVVIVEMRLFGLGKCDGLIHN